VEQLSIFDVSAEDNKPQHITGKGFVFHIAKSPIETIAFHNNVIFVYCHKKEKIYTLRYGSNK
jgi:hypothetical protein